MERKKTSDEEERYVIAPKGIALLAMIRCGLIRDTGDPRFEGFWTLFEHDMIRLGYIVDGEESK